MKRLRRILVNTLTAISLLLAIGTAGLWVRSYWIADHFGFSRPLWAIFMESGGGQLRLEGTQATASRDYIGYSGFFYTSDKADGPLRLGMAMPGQTALIDRWNFWIVTGERWGDEHVAVFVPTWFALSVTLAPSVAWLVKQGRSRSRQTPGHCPACGYDMRANPARCSECGREATTCVTMR